VFHFVWEMKWVTLPHKIQLVVSPAIFPHTNKCLMCISRLLLILGVYSPYSWCWLFTTFEFLFSCPVLQLFLPPCPCHLKSWAPAILLIPVSWISPSLVYYSAILRPCKLLKTLEFMSCSSYCPNSVLVFMEKYSKLVHTQSPLFYISFLQFSKKNGIHQKNRCT
jgi:hypothetical protein